MNASSPLHGISCHLESRRETSAYLSTSPPKHAKNMPLPIQLGELNLRLAAVGDITTELVHDWMWGTDPEEAYHADVLLNRNQLLGLMVCR